MPLAPEDREYLTTMYEENAEHARQHESMRAAATGLSIALIAVLLAFAAGENNTRTWVSGVLVCAVSVLGALVNYKHYERYEFHLKRLQGFRGALESRVTSEYMGINEKTKEKHKQKYSITEKRMKLPIV